MADGFEVKLEGVDELKAALADASMQIRKKAVRNALREAGKVIQAAARASAPVLSTPNINRRPGTIKKAISVRASRQARQDGMEGVYVGVRPLTSAKIRAFKQSAPTGKKSGKNNPNDPFYWWFVEFGHKIVPRSSNATGKGITKYFTRLRNGQIKQRSREYSLSSLTGRRRSAVGQVAARPFMRTAASQKGSEAIIKFMQSVVPQIEKLNERASRGR